MGPGSLLSHRVAQSHSAPIAELYASLDPHMSDVTVARRHMPRELVLMKPILRVSFSNDIPGLTAAVSDNRYSRQLLLQPWWPMLVRPQERASGSSARI